MVRGNPYGPGYVLGDHWIVLGVPQSGKSTLAKKLTRECRVLVCFDPHGDYDSLRGVEIVQPFDSERMTEILDDEHRGIVRICIPAERTPERNVRDEFDWTVSYLRWYRHGAVLVADEVGDYKIVCDDTLKRLHRNGHKDGIVSILVSQRAVDIPLGCRATATRVYSLLQTHEEDIETLGVIVSHMDGPNYESAKDWRPPDPPLVWKRRQLWPK